MAKKVVMPQYITEPAKEFLRQRGYEVLDGYDVTDKEELKKIVAEADALLVRTAPFDAEVLAAAPRCKAVSRQGVGYDNIDVDYCTKNGIWVTYAPQANFNAVAEHTIGLMIASYHNIVSMDREVHKGNWNLRNMRKGHDISGKTIGILGLGRIGSAVAKKAYYGLDMKVIAYDAFLPDDKFPEYVTKMNSLDDVLREADIVSLHVPSNAENRHLVNREFLGKMKKDAILVNCSRGGIISETDLYEALRDNVISGAAVDVMEQEPPDMANPLLTLSNFIVTPHNAALTVETMDKMGLHAAMGIDDVLSGRIPQWPVNRL